jgi:DNA mismatch endonuclease (patch repair protein)
MPEDTNPESEDRLRDMPSVETSLRMSSQGSRDTQPELRIRQRLHAMGLRYRVDFAPVQGLRRRADIVFTGKRVAVFVDGCFWHGCPEHGTRPKANSAWWAEKLDRNMARDADTNEALLAAGWKVVRVWEHEDPGEATARVVAALGLDTA